MRNLTFFTGFTLLLFLANKQETPYVKNGILRNENTDLVYKKEHYFSSVTRPFTDANYSSGTINVSIPDEDVTGVSHTLTASGIPGGATIDSIIVTFNITHTWLEDIVVNLEAPNGQIVNLVANRGENSVSGYSNTRATSDTLVSPFPSGYYATPLTGTYRADTTSQDTIDIRGTINPINPVITTSVFSDLFSIKNGSWKIHVYDISNGDVGTLVDWSLKISYTAGPLPVSLLSFSGYRDGNINRLQWTTASEQNNQGFDVERSKDGISFFSVGFVNINSYVL